MFQSRQTQVNAVERPLCGQCGLRRLVRSEDVRAGQCLVCRLIAEGKTPSIG